MLTEEQQKSFERFKVICDLVDYTKEQCKLDTEINTSYLNKLASSIKSAKRKVLTNVERNSITVSQIGVGYKSYYNSRSDFLTQDRYRDCEPHAKWLVENKHLLEKEFKDKKTLHKITMLLEYLAKYGSILYDVHVHYETITTGKFKTHIIQKYKDDKVDCREFSFNELSINILQENITLNALKSHDSEHIDITDYSDFYKIEQDYDNILSLLKKASQETIEESQRIATKLNEAKNDLEKLKNDTIYLFALKEL